MGFLKAGPTGLRDANLVKGFAMHAVTALANISRRILAPGTVNALERQGLPAVLLSPLRSFAAEKYDSFTAGVIAKVEAERDRLADRGDEQIRILYSPKPGSAGAVGIGNAPDRPQHGEVKSFSMTQVAKTGKDRRWGALMHMIASQARSNVILELGTCAGISGSYLGSAPSCRTFYTIEGSSELCAVATDLLGRTVPHATAINGLFDDVLDRILPTIEPIDFLFIDGHHEKVATIHYWHRIKPHMNQNSIVVFDDISWSEDMREAWEILSQDQSFTDAVDLGTIGICFHSPSHSGEAKSWDLRSLTGVRRIGRPHGWQD
jgi:predicted O-methyltransferase YrrM